MYAIVECGGRQYRAEEGHTFSVEKLPNEVGEQIELDNVLLLSNDGSVTIGQPSISGATVLATVTEQYRGKKIFVWKYKPKKRYRRRRGHRQYYTRLRIDSIVVGGKENIQAAKKAAADKAAAAAAAEAKAAADAAAAAEAAAVAQSVEEAAPVVHEHSFVEDAVEAAEPAADSGDDVAREAPEPTTVAAPASDDVEEAAAEAAPVVEAHSSFVEEAVEETAVSVDDIKLIEGIGPKTEALLNAAGIVTFADLAAKSPEELLVILREAGGRGTPDTWPQQAALAAAGKMDELKQLQDELDGGRRD